MTAPSDTVALPPDSPICLDDALPPPPMTSEASQTPKPARAKPSALGDFHRQRIQKQTANESSPLFTNLSESFSSLIAALVQEQEQELTQLSKYIQHILFPTEFGDVSIKAETVVPLTVIESSIIDVAQRTNYGLNPAPPTQSDNPAMPSSSSSSSANVSVYRWEVRDLDHHFPRDLSRFLTRRREKRQSANRSLTQHLSELDQKEVTQLLQTPGTKRSKKRQFSDLVVPPGSAPTTPSKPSVSDGGIAATDGILSEAAEPISDVTGTIDPPPKKSKLNEKDINSQTKLQGFFTKVLRADSGSSDQQHRPSQTEYEKCFRKFYLRPSTTLATPPSSKMQLSSDFDDLVINADANPQPLAPWSVAHLKSQFNIPDIRRRFVSYGRSRLRAYSILPDNGSVQVQSAVDDAGWAESTVLPVDTTRLSAPTNPNAELSLYSTDITFIEDDFKATRLAAFKLLQFSENIRPPYYGTWSKQSRVISGRRWLARDEKALNYGVDSEAEWELDEEGEDLATDDEGEVDAEDDLDSEGVGRGDGHLTGLGGGDHDDEEGRGWLVPEGYLSEDEILSDDESEVITAGPGLKGKPASGPQLHQRVVQPIVPVILGPFHPTLGQWPIPAQLQWIEQYRVQPLRTTQWPLAIQETKPKMAAPAKTSGVEMTPKKGSSNAPAAATIGGTPSSTSVNTASGVRTPVKAPAAEAGNEVKSLLVRKKAKPEPADLLTIAKILHGSWDSIPTLTERIQQPLPTFSKYQIEQCIRDLAVKEKREVWKLFSSGRWDLENAIDQAQHFAQTRAGWHFIHPFDDATVQLGYVPLMAELQVQLHHLEPHAILCGVGGGGLLAGLLQGLKTFQWPDVPVVAVETHGSNVFQRSRVAGAVQRLERCKTLAGSLVSRQLSATAFELSLSHPVIPFAVSDPMAANASQLFAACGAILSLIYSGVIRDVVPNLQPDSHIVVILTGRNDITIGKLNDFQLKYANPPTIVKSGSEIYMRLANDSELMGDGTKDTPSPV
ncbi:catabolic L-serine/threonine dehydratase [Dimargaris cristalligena]|nr:catabolic L-serine/threonine dehydratase [Dimargaris cristalligena]